MMDRQALEYLLSENKKRRERLVDAIDDCLEQIQDMEEEFSALEVEWHELNDKVKSNRSTFTKEDLDGME